MSNFNFGGPAMSQSIPDETAASRENRDVAQRGGDQAYTEGAHVSVRDGGGATLATVAATATGGRTDRDYLERGGDDVLTFDPENPQNPTETVTAHGRNDREYVAPATGISALSGEKDPLFDELKTGDAPADLAVDPLG